MLSDGTSAGRSGRRCVTIDHTNWDTHYAAFPVLKNELLPQLDGAVPALFRDLSDRGLLDTTLVLVTGEFGRTPGSITVPDAITGRPSVL